MLPFQIKICGITSVDAARQACAVGADAIGLNFYPKSVRFLDDNTASEIVAEIHRLADDQEPVRNYGVFVNESIDHLLAKQAVIGLGGIQLHGNETPEFAVELKSKLPDDVLLMRAIRSRPPMRQGEVDRTELARVAEEIRAWKSTGVTLLIDAKVEGAFGGTGHHVAWKLIPALVEQTDVPLVLAGGLDPWNVADAIRASQAMAVDVASGVESDPGVKDPERVEKFVQQAKLAFGSLNVCSEEK